MEKGKMDPQFKNLDPYKVVATLLKLLGNAEGCEYTFTLRKKDEEKGTAPTVPNKIKPSSL